MVVIGALGSFVGGLVLDRYKKFKLTSLAASIGALVFIACFTGTVQLGSMLKWSNKTSSTTSSTIKTILS